MTWTCAKTFRSGAATALVTAVAVGAVAAASAATPKAKACKGGTVAVSVGAKRKCVSVAKAIVAAPGANVGQMLIHASADRALWARSRYPSMYKALGSKSRGLLTFEQALYTASRAVGKPLVPDVPTPPAAGHRGSAPGGDTETLGLNIQGSPFELVIELAERRQSGNEASSGIQTKEAVTVGTLKPPANGAGEYTVQIKEKFEGDPCPGAGGRVKGKASYAVVREATGLTALYKDVENVVTVDVAFSGVVDKQAHLDHYKMDVQVTGEGGWAGEIHSKPTLKTGGVLRREQVGNFQVTAPTGLDSAAEQKLLGAIYQAIRLAKEQSDDWLKTSQKIWLDKAACNKVTGSGGALQPGQEKTVPVTIKNIRGAHADDTVKLKGVNGLQVVGPTKIKAKNGKANVRVRAPSQRLLTRLGTTPAYALDVEGVSELGRGVGTVTFHAPLPLFDVTVHLKTDGTSPHCSGNFADVTFVGAVSGADPTDPTVARGTGTYAGTWKDVNCLDQPLSGGAVFIGGYTSDRAHIVIGWIAQDPFILLLSDSGELALPQNGTTVVTDTVTGYFNTTTTITITITNLHDG